MNFLNKLERKYGKYAISNLMLYIVLGQAVVLGCTLLTGSTALINFIYFNPLLIIKGQVWRLFTFIFIPNSNSIIFFLFAAFLYYSIGASLERTWGEFKFNLYYLLGVIFNMVGLLAVQLIFYRSAEYGNMFYWVNYGNITYYLNLSLFLAFAALYPDVEFMLYMILPIKVKYLAFLDLALLGYSFITGTTASRVLIIMSLLNFFLFFKDYLVRKKPHIQRQTATPRHRGELKQGPPLKVAFHKCTVCGKTELTDPDMEFRYCSSCNGNYEYCMDHLSNHTHIQ